MASRSSWQIMCDSVHALLMREIKTRFGTNRLGYFWAIAEPVAQAAVIGLIFTLLGRSSVSGISVALFMFTGILPFKLFAKLLPQLSAAVNANKALLAYRQVSAIDPIIARIIIEVSTFIVAYIVIFSVMGWLGFEVIPHDILGVLMASLLLIIIAIGIGLMLCVAMSYWQDTSKIVGMIMRPMFLISGIFFAATMIPQQYWYLFTWNPIFHAIELSRDAFFVSYVTPVGSWLYLSLCALVSFTLGIVTFYQSRMRFLTT
ncbi:MAG: ABC transporter permease [Colwellia sp.]|nr:ABC transporter permease [Colwellia sp.]NQZ25645.1 ABC transporter permease [Colwellia sp.]NRA79915.1 ABC transporter permease [Pseudoalteromonas sp.]